MDDDTLVHFHQLFRAARHQNNFLDISVNLIVGYFINLIVGHSMFNSLINFIFGHIINLIVGKFNCTTLKSILFFDISEADIDAETQELLTADFELGHYIRERIVPRAVLYFTG